MRKAVEPAAIAYEALQDLLSDLEPDDDEDDWVTPNQNLSRLQQITHELGKGAYVYVENPDYDEEECRLWHEENPSRFNQQKVEWGTTLFPGGSVTDDIRESLRKESLRVARNMECQMISGKDAPECDELEKDHG